MTFGVYMTHLCRACLNLGTLLLLIVTTVNVYANKIHNNKPKSYPCEDSCISSPYTPCPFPATITLDSNCQVKVEYETRVCNGVYEVRITKIELLGTGCTGTKISTLTNLAISHLVLYNRMNFPPNNLDTAGKIWRVIRKACWKYESDLLLGKVWLKPCEETDCCISSLYVRKSALCESLNFSQNQQRGKGNCPECEETNPYPENKCCNTCAKDLIQSHFEK